MTPQSLAAVGRQILAVLGVIFGVLTQSVSALHLPVALSSALAVGGTLILAIEHYVSDPSTGSSSSPPAPAAVVPGTTQVPASPSGPTLVHS